MPRKWEFEYEHTGYIAEDHDHVQFDGGGTIEEGDKFGYGLDGDDSHRVVKTTEDALLAAMEAQMGEDLDDPNFLDDCSINVVEGGESTLNWSFDNADGNGETNLTLREVIPGQDWKEYRKKGTTTLRPYNPGEDLTGVSINKEDTPEKGGMIARNKDNHEDKWYVAKKYFEDHYELAE
jgi:hypothetical protein